MTRTIAMVIAWLVAIVAAAVCLIAYETLRANRPPALGSSFHAVLLKTGRPFFGNVENLDTESVVLRDVFYIQSRQNPETKQVSNVLIKRGQEWHAPDRMIVNKRQVLLIEPVTDGSQVAKLIADQQAKQTATPAASEAPAPAQK